MRPAVLNQQDLLGRPCFAKPARLPPEAKSNPAGFKHLSKRFSNARIKRGVLRIRPRYGSADRFIALRDLPWRVRRVKQHYVTLLTEHQLKFAPLGSIHTPARKVIRKMRTRGGTSKRIGNTHCPRKPPVKKECDGRNLKCPPIWHRPRCRKFHASPEKGGVSPAQPLLLLRTDCLNRTAACPQPGHRPPSVPAPPTRTFFPRPRRTHRVRRY